VIEVGGISSIIVLHMQRLDEKKKTCLLNVEKLFVVRNGQFIRKWF
jgi:hypothetical protein